MQELLYVAAMNDSNQLVNIVQKIFCVACTRFDLNNVEVIKITDPDNPSPKTLEKKVPGMYKSRPQQWRRGRGLDCGSGDLG